jgi:hypothetical protein
MLNWVNSVVLKNAELSEQRYSKEYRTEWVALFLKKTIELSEQCCSKERW